MVAILRAQNSLPTFRRRSAGVEELEGRMRKAQWRTRKIESEKMAVAFKRKTLRTDLKELFDNRVKFLEEHTEKLRVELEVAA